MKNSPKKPVNNRPVKQLFSQFCLSHGVSKPVKPEVFEKKLVAKFKETGRRYIDQMQALANGESLLVDPNSIVYSSLEFSNMVIGQMDTDRLGAFCEWLFNRYDFSDKTIIDLGCGSGLLTCFIARQFPDARVIGIDISEDATLVTDSRAIGLKLTNVGTFTGTLESFIKGNGLDHVDFVISSNVYAEKINTDVFKAGVIDPADRDVPQQSQSDISLIASLLGDDGVYISQDAWPLAESFCRWVRICEASGLRCLVSQSRALMYSNIAGHPQLSPVAVFMKNTQDTPAVRREDVIAAYSRPRFEMQKIEGNEALADAIFSGWNKTDLYVGKAVYEAYDITFVTRIGIAGGIGYCHATNDKGWMLLEYGPSVRVREFVEGMEQTRATYQSEGAKISWETFHPELCDQLGLDFGDGK